MSIGKVFNWIAFFPHKWDLDTILGKMLPPAKKVLQSMLLFFFWKIGLLHLSAPSDFLHPCNHFFPNTIHYFLKTKIENHFKVHPRFHNNILCSQCKVNLTFLILGGVFVWHPEKLFTFARVCVSACACCVHLRCFKYLSVFSFISSVDGVLEELALKMWMWMIHSFWTYVTILERLYPTWSTLLLVAVGWGGGGVGGALCFCSTHSRMMEIS